MDLQPGTHVTSNVRLVCELGRGGMGSVWIADHTSLGTRVAVKFVAAELVKEDGAILERFNREASMSAQIKSPYVVQTFDHGVMEGGRPYIVMELLEGQSLAEVLDVRTLSLDETRLVVSQTAKALSKAHRLGIVHRDIKPDNLFLTYEDEELFLKVLDFGIAKQTGLPKASAVTGTGVMMGTPEYMSPEQVLSAKSVDFRSDLFALAVVAYHCLTGRVPFTGETLGSLCVAIANGQFTPPSTLRPEVPPAVDAWFLRALDKDPQKRFESARQAAKAFTAALTGDMSAENSASFNSSDWSGQFAAVNAGGGVHGGGLMTPGGMQTSPTVQTGPGMHTDAMSLAHAAAASNPGASGSRGVPTFAGTTVDPDVPRKRTMAALGIVIVLTVVGGGVAVGLLTSDRDTVATPAADSARADMDPASQGEAPNAGPTSEVSAMVDGEDDPPEPATEPQPGPDDPEGTEPSDAEEPETVAPAPSAEASSEKQSHDPPGPAHRPPTSPRPPTRPTTPKPTGDKYGF